MARNFISLLFAVFAASTLVNAQAVLTPCILQCWHSTTVEPAVGPQCLSGDSKCYCNSSDFQSLAAQCVQKGCTPAENQQSSDLLKALCDGGGFRTCPLTCVQIGSAGASCSLADTKCLCNNSQFQQIANQCLEQTCTSDEKQQGLAIEGFQCGPGSASGTTSAGSPTSSSVGASAHSSLHSTSTTGPAPSTTPNAETGRGQQVSHIVGILVPVVLGLQF